MSKDLKANSVDSLTTTSWNQDHPYNYQLRLEEETTTTTPVGCVGVAGAQIINYHRHPKKTKGIIYDKYKEINIDINDFEYDWDSMSDKINNYSPQINIDAVSTLLYHSRIIAGSTYYAAGYCEEFISNLPVHFGYDKHIGFVDLYTPEDKYFSYTELQALIREELDNHRPVLISVPGHAVVCDGYREDGYFSFNYGWGRPPYWFTLDNGPEGCNPIRAFIGIRPEFDTDLSVELFSVSSSTTHPKSKINSLFNLENVSAKNISGCFRIILIDKNGVRRAYLSDEYKLDIATHETKNFDLALSIPEQIYLGEGSIGIEWHAEGEQSVFLRNREDSPMLSDIEITRKTSSQITLTNLIIPEKVSNTDILDVSLTVASTVNMTTTLSLLAADENTNVYAELGNVFVDFTANEINDVVMAVDFSTLKPQAWHKIILVHSDINAEYSNRENILSSNIGLPYKIYVKNGELEYTNQFFVKSGIDVSKQYYANGSYMFDLSLSISDDIPTPHLSPNISYEIIDMDNNVMTSMGFAVRFNNTEDVPISIELSLPTYPLDESVQSQQFTFQVIATDENGRKLLTPFDAGVLNPQPLTIYYRNIYDYIFLEKTLSIDSQKKEPGAAFNLGCALKLLGDNYNFSIGEVVNAVVCLEASTGEIYEIGQARTMAYMSDPKTTSINCRIPDDILNGTYRLFLKAVNGYNETGPSRPKVFGLNEQIIDEINIVISDESPLSTL